MNNLFDFIDALNKVELTHFLEIEFIETQMWDAIYWKEVRFHSLGLWSFINDGWK